MSRVIRKSNIFIAASISFLGGVLFGSVIDVDRSWLYAVAAFGFVVFALGRKHVRVVGLCLVLLALGAFRIQTERAVSGGFTEWFGEKQNFEAVVVEDIDVRTDRQLLTVQPNGYSQRVLITTTAFGSYFYGDRIWVRGKVTEPAAFEDFDYRTFLKRHNVYAVMRYPKIIVLKSGQEHSVTYRLLKIKAWVTSTISKRLGEPQGSLLLGILIGAKKTLPENVQENFSITGTSHIVAVSGFNISVIVGALSYLARVLGRRASFWVSLLCIVGFVIMAGGSSSVIRAGVMGGVLLMSYNIGRLYAIGPSLCLAAAVMVMVNPRVLYWDVGFQLSFAATIGIVYGVPVLSGVTQKIPEWFGIKTVLLVTLAATSATLPFILLNFERLSTVTIIVNLLVVPLIPLIMLLGAAVLLPIVGTGFAFVVNFLLQYILATTAWFAQLPFASIQFGISKVTFIALCFAIVCLYGLLKFWVYRARIIQNREAGGLLLF